MNRQRRRRSSTDDDVKSGTPITDLGCGVDPLVLRQLAGTLEPLLAVPTEGTHRLR